MENLFSVEITRCHRCGDFLTKEKSPRCIRCGNVVGNSISAIISEIDLGKILLNAGNPDFIVLENQN